MTSNEIGVRGSQQSTTLIQFCKRQSCGHWQTVKDKIRLWF